MAFDLGRQWVALGGVGCPTVELECTRCVPEEEWIMDTETGWARVRCTLAGTHDARYGRPCGTCGWWHS